jgi:hypothetical protein
MGCSPSAIVVRERPVRPAYAQPPAPSPAYIWVEGNWIKRGHGYVYRKGYWVAPRRGRYHYSAGHWQHKKEGWIWIHGHW